MNLSVKPTSATLFRDTQVFSNMDPYVVIKVGTQKRTTKTHTEGGKNPRWNDVLIFGTRSNSMLVTVYDKDVFSDDEVGTGNVNLTKFFNSPSQEIQQRVDLTYKGKKAGVLRLLIKYQSGAQQPGKFSAWGNSNPNTNNNSGWGNQNNSWGSGNNNNNNQNGSGWGNQNNNNWGNNNSSNNGWDNQGWGSNQVIPPNNNNSGWGQPNNQQQSWGQPNCNNNQQNLSNQNGWNQPPQSNPYGSESEQVNPLNILTNILTKNVVPPNNNNSNNGWGPSNNNGW